MRRLRRLYRATLGDRRTLTSVVILLLVVFGVGFSTNFWLPLRLGYILLFGLLAAGAWTALHSRGLRVEVERDGVRLEAGQSITERVVVHNALRTPKFWLEMEELSDLPGHESTHVINLGGRSRRSWRMETVCRRRGAYTLGPIVVRSGDPFDLFHSERIYGEAQEVLVYPQPLDLPHYAVPPANLPGEGRIRRRTHYVTPNASGLRDYEPGDSVNRIHWPSTLRTGRMLVKTFELDPASNMWVLLDLERTEHVGLEDDASVETAVTVAASVARLFLGRSRSVGLMSFGDGLLTVEPDRGGQHFTRMLEQLALAQPVGDVPLQRLLHGQARRWGRHTTLVIVTASIAHEWVDALRSLTRRGVKAAVVLLDQESFGGRAGAEEVEGELRSAGIQVNRVRRGDYLPETLSPQRGSTRAAGVAGERVSA